MNKILLIIQKEIKQRLQSKVFWIMTLLGPFILSALLIVPIGLQMNSHEQVIIEIGYNREDETEMNAAFKNSDEIRFIPITGEEENIKLQFVNSSYDALLFLKSDTLPKIIQFHNQNIYEAKVINQLQKRIFNFYQIKFEKKHLSPELKEKLSALKGKIKLENKSYEDVRHETMYNSVASSLSLGAAIILYFFMMLYGLQIMRSTSEEKQNRVLEVLLTSMSGTQLLLGKVIGVGAACMLQFIVWIGISSGVSKLFYSHFQLDMYAKNSIENTLQILPNKSQAMEMFHFVEAIQKFNLIGFVLLFLVTFIAGYLFYALLLAIAGAATESENDHQHLLFPITIPLFISFLFAQNIIQAPDGILAKCFTYIPFTSPIALILRFPFGLQIHEIMLSLSELFLFTFLLSKYGGKIFKRTLLTHGKKMDWIKILLGK